MARCDAKSIWLFLGFFAVGAMFLSHDQKMMMMMVAGEDCEGDIRGFDIECLIYMAKGGLPLQNPNDRCCNVIKAANIPCVCSKVSRKLDFPPNTTMEDLLDWKKVLHCLNYCGKPLAVGTKCGHFTVPPGPPPTRGLKA